MYFLLNIIHEIVVSGYILNLFLHRYQENILVIKLRYFIRLKRVFLKVRMGSKRELRDIPQFIDNQKVNRTPFFFFAYNLYAYIV